MLHTVYLYADKALTSAALLAEFKTLRAHLSQKLDEAVESSGETRKGAIAAAQ